MSEPFLIVTCDGGGLRGTLPALLLRKLGDGLVQRAAMFAGTSTGSFICTMLANGRSVEEVAGFYTSEQVCGSFYQPYEPSAEELKKLEALLEAGVLDSLLRADEGAGGGADKSAEPLKDQRREKLKALIFPVHSSAAKRSTIGKFLSDKAPLKEVSKPLLVTTSRLSVPLAGGDSSWEAAAMHNLPVERWSRWSGVAQLDAVLASGAMPPGFAPEEVGGELFADGLMCANNPATLALSMAYAAGLIGPRGVPFKDVYLLSLGTGSYPAHMPPTEPAVPFGICPWGKAGWFFPSKSNAAPPMPFFHLLADTNQQMASEQVELILGSSHFRRWTWDLSRAPGEHPIATDRCSEIPRLVALAEESFATPEFAALEGWLRALFG